MSGGALHRSRCTGAHFSLATTSHCSAVLHTTNENVLSKRMTDSKKQSEKPCFYTLEPVGHATAIASNA